MGKLADRINDVLEGPPRPMGFRATSVQAKAPTMLLLSGAEAGDSSAVSDSLRAGSQGALIPVGPATDADTLKAVSTAAAGGIWGGILEMGGKADVERLAAAGAHFAVFGSGAVSGDALEVEDIDKVLEVEEGWPDMLLRAVDRLPLEAAIYRLQAVESMSIAQVLQCRRVIGLVGKPVLAALPAGVGPWVLPMLRDAGVVGVIVPAASIAQFHAAIRELPPIKKPKERMEATLPTSGRPGMQGHEEEDDDGEED